MSFFQTIKNVFVNWANFKGRTGRKEFWSFILFLIIAQAAIGMFKYSISYFENPNVSLEYYFNDHHDYGYYFQDYEDSDISIDDIFTLICNIFLMIPLCSLIFRRLHDAGKSGLRILLLTPWIIIFFCYYPRVFFCWGPFCWVVATLPESLWIIFFTGIFGPFAFLVQLLKASKLEDFEEDDVPQLQTYESKESVELTDEEKKKKAVRTTILFLFIDAAILITIFMIAFRPDSNWSKRSLRTMNWNDAKQYCENLRENGYTDWRLPTISELKTTIKNCQSGGSSCKASDSCLSSKNCWSESCRCKYRENNGGYYSKLKDYDKVYLWSSSTTSDNEYNAWFVNFEYGEVSDYNKSYNAYVRCIR